MDGNLLGVIAQASGYFISDLRDATNRPHILLTLRKLQWSEYSLEECNYCLSYIFGLKFNFQQYDEIPSYLDLAE